MAPKKAATAKKITKQTAAKLQKAQENGNYSNGCNAHPPIRNCVVRLKRIKPSNITDKKSNITFSATQLSKTVLSNRNKAKSAQIENPGCNNKHNKLLNTKEALVIKLWSNAEMANFKRNTINANGSMTELDPKSAENNRATRLGRAASSKNMPMTSSDKAKKPDKISKVKKNDLTKASKAANKKTAKISAKKSKAKLNTSNGGISESEESVTALKEVNGVLPLGTTKQQNGAIHKSHSTAHKVKKCKILLKRVKKPEQENSSTKKCSLKGKNEVNKEEKSEAVLLSDNNEPPKTRKFFHRRKDTSMLQERKSSMNRETYDFLSSTQQETRQDPANDIVQQMIKEGKVRVATRWKGRGKPKIKPITKQKASRPIRKKKDHEIVKKHMSISPTFEPGDEDSNMEFDFAPISNKQTNMNATYSPIARLAFTKDRKNKTPQITTRGEMIRALQRCSNTPRSSKKPFANSTPANANNSDPKELSPWRVSDESAMPKTFYFGRSSENLPSFSSDFITRNKRDEQNDVSAIYYNSKHRNSRPNASKIDFQLPNKQIETTTLSNKNNSNTENIPPLAVDNFEKTIAFNSSTDSEKIIQLSNTRKTRSSRTPLQRINILDVMVLPSWKPNTNIINEIDSSAQKSTAKQINNRRELNKSSDAELYGFDEFLSDESADISDPINLEAENNVRGKLNNLRKLRPRNVEQLITTSLRRAKTYDYDDIEAGLPKQRNVKEMLNSTALNQRAKIKADAEEQHICSPTKTIKNTNQLQHWAVDIDTTLDHKKQHRTYEHAKGKRMPVQWHVDMFAESDESDEDTVLAKKQERKKRTKKDEVNDSDEVEKFAKEFNEMCNDVDRYELIIV